MIGQMAIELDGVLYASIRFGAPARIEDLRRGHLRRCLYHPTTPYSARDHNKTRQQRICNDSEVFRRGELVSKCGEDSATKTSGDTAQVGCVVYVAFFGNKANAIAAQVAQ